MAGEYQTPQVQTAANDLAAEAFGRMQTTNPTWSPKAGKASTKLVEAHAAMLAAQHGRFADLADIAAEQVFTLQGSPRTTAVAATASLTVASSTTTVGDRKLAAGTTYVLARADGESVVAEQTADVTIPDGSGSTAAGGVIVRVLEESASGIAGNGYGGAGATLQAPVYTWAGAVSVVTPTSGGVDEQDTAEYLDYATLRSRLLTYQPIRAGEWAVAALTHPRCGRAAEIPLYDADTSTAGEALHITVPVAGTDGLAMSSGDKAEIRDVYLATLGGVSVHVVDFNYTRVNCAASYVPRGTPDDAAVEAAIRAYLASLTYGLPSTGEVQPTYQLLDHVYYRDLIGALDQVDCVERINHVYLSTGATAPTVQQDVSLPGVAPLPTLTSATITVAHT